MVNLKRNRPPQHLMLYDIISQNARAYERREAVVFNDIRLSYGEYKYKCDQIAAGLVREGILKGDRLGIISRNCIEFMLLWGAAAKIGAILLPVNWRFQPKEIEYILQDGSPKIVFAGSDYHAMIFEVSGKVKSIQGRFTIGGEEKTEGFRSFSELYGEPDGNQENEFSPDSGFVIIHTAAVDGRPRGALLSQANILFANWQAIHQYGLTPKDSHISLLPLFHIAGLATTMAVFHAGGKNVLIDQFDPERVLRLIEKEKGTLFFNFAPILKNILDVYDQRKFDISSIRNVSGLDTEETIQRFLQRAPQARYWSGFGQTEIMHVSACSFQEKPGSAGRPSPFTRVSLMDEYDREVPTGTPGEICVRSPAVFLGYWGREEDTAYAFRNGWHHTGDIGRFDEEGYLWYVKRKSEKELIKPGGENVYPAEVEGVLAQHESVSEVSVIGVRDPEWGEAIKAVCVLRPGTRVTPQELMEFVASKIARYKKPKYVVFVDSLPKTQDGYIDRERVKKEHGAMY